CERDILRHPQSSFMERTQNAYRHHIAASNDSSEASLPTEKCFGCLVGIVGAPFRLTEQAWIERNACASQHLLATKQTLCARRIGQWAGQEGDVPMPKREKMFRQLARTIQVIRLHIGGVTACTHRINED